MQDHPEFVPTLRVADGPMRGVSFRLSRVQQVIGRAMATADIVLQDPHLSRKHATVQVTDEGVALVDLGSTNGTWVNDRRIDAPAWLSDGDVIRMGRSELRFSDPGMARTDPVGIRFDARQTHRPTLPLPIAPNRRPQDDGSTWGMPREVEARS
ncbi:FHA domain-containing protein [Micromonospora mirobrigensis]|uniref:FHA domain-containing protein n=1 Tax=Micromonospora mirobrigensis TaxID=262898 RepID=A0A1C4XMK2_9ACTN|nr:FHA domain-containing protein [Micromonospora mirobrigensis]